MNTAFDLTPFFSLSAAMAASSFTPRAERGVEVSGGMGEAKLPPSLLSLSSLPLPRSLAGIARQRRRRGGWGWIRTDNHTTWRRQQGRLRRYA